MLVFVSNAKTQRRKVFLNTKSAEQTENVIGIGECGLNGKRSAAEGKAKALLGVGPTALAIVTSNW